MFNKVLAFFWDLDHEKRINTRWSVTQNVTKNRFLSHPPGGMHVFDSISAAICRLALIFGPGDETDL